MDDIDGVLSIGRRAGALPTGTPPITREAREARERGPHIP
jgi:hypothetical protein